MERTFALYDSDFYYATRFMEYFKKKRDVPFEVIVFTHLESLKDYLRTNNVNVLLSGSDLDEDEIYKNKVKYIYQFTQDQRGRPDTKECLVYKYQPVWQVMQELLKDIRSREHRTDPSASTVGVKIITVFLPKPRQEALAYVIALHSILSRQANVLLINLELLPVDLIKELKSERSSLSEIIYYIKENKDIQVYHKDVKAYDVFDNDGSFLAVLYVDFFPREGKRPGAWMTNFQEQWKDNNGDYRPHVSITMNFTKPVGDNPSLLSYSEVNTLLHEFGHALHSIFSQTTYKSLSGTNVYWDFVELPSQIMENYANEKDFLNTFAKHYKTGEQISSEIIQNLVNASNFNVGYLTIRQLSLGYLDMAWYDRKEKFDGDIFEFEKKVFDKTRLLPSIDDCCMSVHFSHIMSGGYAAGYYSYKWAEVLDADAFSLFQKYGIFSSSVASAFRENILSKGGTKNPMELFKSFKGEEPTIDALLKRNNIIN